MASWKINIDPFANSLLEQLKKLALFEFIDTAPIKTALKNFFGIADSKDSKVAKSAQNSRILSDKESFDQQ